MTNLPDLVGVWRRSLLIGATGTRDDTTDVTWLQGVSVYADIRKPQTHISFAGVKALRCLDAAQVEALARQEGFAGTLVQHPDHFEWIRSIDFQPQQQHGDRGKLDDLGHVMIEEGYDIPYREHWHRVTSEDMQAGALVLSDIASGCSGIICRIGNHFAFARGRTKVLSGPGNLIDFVRKAASLEKAQNLINCEVSTGSAISEWLIERSTLPYRETALLAPRFVGEILVTTDVTPEGKPCQRRWTVIAREGLFFTDP